MQTIVSDLIKEADTDEEKVKAILDWFNISDTNIFNNYHLWKKGVNGFSIWPRGQFKIYFGEPYFGIRTFNDDDSLWVLTSRYGHCGEYGLIFRDMADAAGLTVTKVTCSGEDHVWNEVLIDDDWVVIDATRVGSAPDDGYNVSYDFMQRKVAGDRGILEGNISYIEAEYLNGSTIDVTSKYTDVVNVIVFISDQDGNPVKDATITIQSNNRYNLIETEKKGIITNDSGLCSFSIGAGDYQIQALTNDFIPLFGKKIVSFSEKTPNYNLTIVLKSDWTKSTFLVYPLYILVFLAIIIIIKYRMWLFQKTIHIGLIAEKHRREFVITFISFFGLWFLNLIEGGLNLVFIGSFLLFIIPASSLILSNHKIYNFMISKYLKRKFRNQKIGILDGRINANQLRIQVRYPKKYDYKPRDWYKRLEKANLDVERIPASNISNKYSMIINPLGATYIEEDIANLKTLNKIIKYITNGGVFINCSDLAFWHSWNSEDRIEGFTSPLVTTYAMDTGKLNISLFTYFLGNPWLKFKSVLENGTSLIDTWLYKQFGIRTTLGGSQRLESKTKFEYLKDVEGTKINEFRAALSCDREDSTMIPLIFSKINKKHQCYPVVTIHKKIGYLILFGVAISKNGNEFDFISKTIKILHDKLVKDGNFV